MTKTLRVAMATAFMAMGAATVQAQTPGPVGNSLEIRLINNHTSPVRVYVEDTFGRVRSLGWVNRSDAKTLSVPASMTRLSAVRITVVSDAPVWSPREVPEGVRTPPLNLKSGDVVDFRVEPRLPNSHVQIVRT